MGIISSLFGGSSSKSENKAYDFLKGAYGSSTSSTGEATSALRALLGLGGDQGAADAGFKNFRNNSGYRFMLDEGQDGIVGNFAAKGLMNSGAAARRLARYRSDLASTTYQQYLSNMLDYGKLGLGAGQLIAGAGQTSKGSSDTGGLGKAIGAGLSMIGLSDRRTKQNIEKVGQLDNGLNIYEYEYIDDKSKTRYVGVMADEVKKIQPEALGPKYLGFDTVDYGKIEGWTD